MKVIVIRQPSAWLIVNGFKDIENRSWATRYRGPLLIQASAAEPSVRDMDDFREYASKRGVKLPREFALGGIVGMARIEDCVTRSRSKWFEGPVGWVLSKPKRLPFVPLKGQLGLFDPPKQVLTKCKLPSSEMDISSRVSRGTMSPKDLARRIARFAPRPPMTTALENALNGQGDWDRADAWYKSQKEHWLGWLSEYGGPGFYSRKNSNRTAEFVYNHVVCPPMVLWLGEAAGISRTKVQRAKCAALSAGHRFSAQSAAIRKVIPWTEIEAVLTRS
jgi:hypothetical protein